MEGKQALSKRKCTNIKCDKNNAAKHTACLLRGCYVGGEGAIGGKSEDGK